MTDMTSARLLTRGPAFRRVFSFFFFLARRTGKVRLFVFLALIPVILSVVVVALAGRSGAGTSDFNDILMVFYLQFFIVLLSLFYGTSVTAEEVEGRTLSYLVTRPVAKPILVAGKFAAYTGMAFLIVGVSLALSFFIMNSARLGDPGLYVTFLHYAGVLMLGIMAYTALFTFLGTLLKRAVLVGLVFGFGWENVIQYFPGSTQRFSLVHYLKSLLPYHYSGRGGGLTSLLLFRLEPTPPVVAVLVLVVVIGVCLALACAVFRWKEFSSEE